MLEVRLQREIVIRTANQVGLLAQVTRLLYDMGIHVLAGTVQAENSEASIHLITDAQTCARDALRDAGFGVEEREVVVITLPRHPGFLCRALEALARKEIDIEHLYTTVADGSSKAIVVFTCSSNGKATMLLTGH